MNLFGLPVDGLSVFFLLVVSFTLLTGVIYAPGYMTIYKGRRPVAMTVLHYFSLLLLFVSMAAVCILKDGLSFLIAWEIMSLSSFLLVIFENEKRETLKTGINYLIQMHIGMFLILGGFLAALFTGGEFGFNGLIGYFAKMPNWPLFLLFFAGFGIKAGFIPFHTWLPDAHPAAPSHVSGIMSGVMIKLGIYGIARVLLYVQHDFLVIGVFLLVISLITGIYGVLQAIVQHDLKKLLAYHSIENIGIIGIGLGLGCIGLGTGNPMLAMMGFTGGLLHVLNHSLFKSLLFYGAGGVYKATHTRNMELLGGLGKKMPYTSALFLIGALAICGLPPFNGFISEYLLYVGMIGSLHGAGLYQSITLIMSMIGLTLIGGLALFCFTKAYGVVFLGSTRSEKVENAVESPASMIIPQMMIAGMILLIGLLPVLFVNPLAGIVSDSFHIPFLIEEIPYVKNLNMISLTGGVFILLTVALLLIRRSVHKNRIIEEGPTWGCGYTAGSARMQYTASSFADPLASLAGPLVNVQKHTKVIEPTDIWPKKRHFESHSSEKLESWFIDLPVKKFRKILRSIAFLQTGQIRHYILYPFIFILFIFLLTLLNLI